MSESKEAKRLTASDFYWDYDRGYDRRTSIEVTVKSEMLKAQERCVLSMNGQYAIMDKNGGYVTSSGVLVPPFIKTDDDLIKYIDKLEDSYNKGVSDGIKKVKRRFECLFDTNR
tara:strand:+ start:653 stop:994 length:342 start_codon:yes stop_codon:yes gene_type:complete